jgi:hypothetical protein
MPPKNHLTFQGSLQKDLVIRVFQIIYLTRDFLIYSFSFYTRHEVKKVNYRSLL